MKRSRNSVDWITDVPVGWKVKPICRIASVDDDALSDDLDGLNDFRYVDISSVDHIEGIKGAITVQASEAPSRARRLARQGDVVVSTVRTYLKAVAEVTSEYSDCVFSTGFAVLRANRSELSDGYLKWALLNENLIQAVEAHSEGLSYPAINSSALVKLKLPVPPIQVQQGIVTFLDKATFHLDALVAKKIRFIELLREKRQALITQAVTKGLDPSVPMKDSGVEWLGKVPADWKVVSLKRIGRLKGGSVFPPNLQGRPENDLPFFKVGDLGKSPDGQHLGDTENTITHGEAKELGATVFPADALVWAKIGAALSLNRRRITTRPSCLDNNMTGFVPDTTLVSTRYCFYLMSSVDFTVHAKPGAVPSFSEGDQGELHISLPPKKFQNAIVIHLDRATSRIDTLIAKTERSIELLREHRTALITAAVTGKIDLRDAA